MAYSKFHKNAIITGYIDSYCLVCESHLRSEDDVNIHIGKPIHTKNLNSYIYVEKYEDDCVRKVIKGYYCEFCNQLLSTMAKVGLHIAEAKHNENKGSQLLKRVGNSVVAFEDLLIDEKAWHGLIEDTCAICDTDFDNEDIHKNEPSHILNLIQSRIEFGPRKTIYRKIDEVSFQCLTCNVVLASSTLSTHFDESEHEKLYLASRQPNPKIERIVFAEVLEQKPRSTVENVKEPTTKETTKEAPLFRPGFLNIPENVAKKPETPVEIPKKIEKSHGNVEKVFCDLDDEICEALGAKDYIAQDAHGKKWCIMCDWTMDCVAIFTHVYGRHHQTMLKMHTERIQKKLANEPLNTNIREPKVEKECEASTVDKENTSKILVSLSKYQKNDININFVTCTANCKKCNKNLDFNFKLLESHLEEHKKKEVKPVKKENKPAPITIGNQNKTDDAKKTISPVLKHNEDTSDTRASSAASSREMDEEAEKFAKANDLAYSHTDNKVYCRVCDSRVPSSLKNMKEHITGISHKNRAAKVFEFRQMSKPVTVKIPTIEFVRNLTAVENGFLKDVIINEKYCVNLLSFMMITKVALLHCEACDVNLTIDQIDWHKGVPSHERAMSETLVVASMDSEFVREVRPGIYHCGYCNLTEASEEDLEAHMKRSSHQESKTSANWRLQQYQPEVIQYRAQRQQQELEAASLMKLLISDSTF